MQPGSAAPWYWKLNASAQGQAGGRSRVGVIPKVRRIETTSGQRKVDAGSDLKLDWRGKGGKFLLRRGRGCCGSWRSSTGKSDGSGSSRGSGRLGSGGEVEGRERGIGIVGVTGVK